MWAQFLSCCLGHAANAIFLDVHLSRQHLGCILGNVPTPLKTAWCCDTPEVGRSYTACSRNPSRIAAHASKSGQRKVETWLKKHRANVHSGASSEASACERRKKRKQRGRFELRLQLIQIQSDDFQGPGGSAWCKHLKSGQTQQVNKTNKTSLVSGCGMFSFAQTTF